MLPRIVCCARAVSKSPVNSIDRGSTDSSVQAFELNDRTKPFPREDCEIDREECHPIKVSLFPDCPVEEGHT